MPIYEYICTKCSEKFSVLQGIGASSDETECPRCRSREVKKTFSSFSCSSKSHGGSSPVSAPGAGGG